MNILVIVLFVFGVFEIISNSFHLTKGDIKAIGTSAKKQHRELLSTLEEKHFFYKALIMLFSGLMFFASALIFFVSVRAGIFCLFFSSYFFSLYGLAQLICYYKNIRVWFSFIVYSLPIIACYLIIR
jgi:hypothetical protein